MSTILKPTVLWTPTATLTSDEACTSIYQYQLAPAPSSIPAPYHTEPTTTRSLSYLPPLEYFCIKALIEWPDQIHALGPAQLRYEPPLNRNDFDIIQALIPTYHPFSPDHDDFDLQLVDPRLWAVLAQIFGELPPSFRSYTLPLSDVHLPLLQRIPSTSHFSLITVLSLSKCRHLTDDTVVELRELHTLAALDASVTALGTWGVLRLAKTLSWSDGDDEPNAGPQRRGLWGLRVLYLSNCLNVDNKVLPCLSRFPLLSVVDLRGTTCRPWLERNLPFNASPDTRLYDPTNLTSVLAHLSSLTEKPSTLFSNQTPYILRVDSLYHKTNTTHYGRPVMNPWDPYGEYDDCELGMQVARGRMDVFLSPKSERYYEPCPYDGVGELGDGNLDELHSEEHEDYLDIYREDSDPFDRKEDEDKDGGEDDEQPSAPWDMSDPRSGEGLVPRRAREEPQPEVPRSWMDAAEDEMRMHRNRVSADRFYVLPGPRRTSSMPKVAAAQSHGILTLTANPKPLPDRLTLFRTPPPWSSLPSRPPPPPQFRRSGMAISVFASSLSSTTRARTPPASQPPPKRRQAEGDTIVPADQARKGTRTFTSLQPIFGAMQKRFESAASGKGKEKEQVAAAPLSAAGPAAGANPFARRKRETATFALSDVLKRLKPAGPTSSPSGPVQLPRSFSSSERKPRENSEPGPSSKPRADPPPSIDEEYMGTKGPSKRPASSAVTLAAADSAPPRPAKKLKPITSLPVPEWPGKPMKRLSQHMVLMPPFPGTQKQTTLPMGSEAAKARVQRRVSAPTRLQLASSKPKKGADGGTRKPQDKGTEKLVRQPSGGGKGFDWKGWSAG